MSTKEDYTPAEWSLIADAVAMAGLAVAAAAPSGQAGGIDELYAFFVEAPGAEDHYDEYPLVRSYKEDARLNPERPTPSTSEASRPLLEEAVDRCRQLADLLARRTTPEEAEAFKRWLVSACRRVAEAAVERRLFGLRSERVSPQEVRSIQAIAAALGAAYLGAEVSG